MQLYANWNFPTHVKIGSGALAEIGNCCKDLKINQPLTKEYSGHSPVIKQITKIFGHL